MEVLEAASNGPIYTGGLIKAKNRVSKKVNKSTSIKITTILYLFVNPIIFLIFFMIANSQTRTSHFCLEGRPFTN
jgi:hypothetical protein